MHQMNQKEFEIAANKWSYCMVGAALICLVVGLGMAMLNAWTK